MKRHPLNTFSLVFGVILLLAAVWIAFPTRGWLFDIPQWLPSVAVILVGVALIGPLFKSRAGDTEPVSDNTNADPSGKATDSADGAG